MKVIEKKKSTSSRVYQDFNQSLEKIMVNDLSL